MSIIDWSVIDLVLLDMDGTLLDLHFDNHFWLQHTPAAYARKHGLSHEEAFERLSSRFAREQGTLNWYCVDFWSRELGLDIAALKHEVRERISEHPTTRQFLTALNRSGRDAWLVTNAHHKSLALKLDHTGIGNFFTRIICSHDYQTPKETPAFWRRLQEEAPFNPERCLLIDDSEPVLHAAKDFGIGHLLTIAQPDRQRPPRTDLHFPALHSYEDILPIPYRGPVRDAQEKRYDEH